MLDKRRAPFVPVSPVTLCRDLWQVELEGDVNSSFIMNGITDGFSLVDSVEVPSSFICKNYKSSAIENRTLVENKFIKSWTWVVILFVTNLLC